MAYEYVAFTDDVIDAIERDVASHAPERGGALLGPVGQPVVTRFLFDPDAHTSGSTYQPSRALNARVRKIEENEPLLELKGILHSHPAGYAQPSGGDRIAFADSLRGAPWLGRFVTPIVTQKRASGTHDIEVPSGTISVFVAERRDEGVELAVAEPHVIPLVAHTKALARFLRGRASVPSLIEIDGSTHLAAGIEFGAYAVQVLAGSEYPFTPPIVLVSQLTSRASDDKTALIGLPAGFSIGSTAALPISWDQATADDNRLLAAIAPFVGSTDVVAKPSVAAPKRGEGETHVEGRLVRTGIRDRLTDITSPALQSKRVLIVGGGSGGSTTAEALVRSGVEHFVVIDPEEVGPENLSRSVYTAADVGTLKVDALGRRLLSINPLVEYDGRPTALDGLSNEELAALVKSVDLVIAATDDPAAQRTLNHFSYTFGIPSIFAGMYAKGQAGEVMFVVPEITRCYRCATATRHGMVSGRRTDYGTGRLTGEPALGADILHVVTASVKIALGLLEIEEDEGASRDFIYGCLTSNLTYLVLSTVPSYDYFPEVFKDTPGQHAYQSVWLSVAGDPECPVCGDNRADPLMMSSTGTPDLTRLRPLPSPTIEPPEMSSELLDEKDAGVTTVARFDRFLANLDPTEAQVTDAIVKLDGVAETLHCKYYDSEFDGSTRRLVGSYGKGTAVRPPRDVDILFVLPPTEYVRYKGYESNGPSQLLQEVKEVLKQRYSTTDSMRGDGHVVVVNFTDGHCVEVLPAWETINGRYLVPDTHDGGSWVLVDQTAEMDNVENSNTRSGGTTRRLIKMLKTWQRECAVPISSLTLELRSVEFLAGRRDAVVDSDKSPVLLVEFFADLVTRGGQAALVPGTADRCEFGTAWVSKAESALARAVRASDFEDRGDETAATEIWKMMFGGQFES